MIQTVLNGLVIILACIFLVYLAYLVFLWWSGRSEEGEEEGVRLKDKRLRVKGDVLKFVNGDEDLLKPGIYYILEQGAKGISVKKVEIYYKSKQFDIRKLRNLKRKGQYMHVVDFYTNPERPKVYIDGTVVTLNWSIGRFYSELPQHEVLFDPHMFAPYSEGHPCSDRIEKPPYPGFPNLNFPFPALTTDKVRFIYYLHSSFKSLDAAEPYTVSVIPGYSHQGTFVPNHQMIWEFEDGVTAIAHKRDCASYHPDTDRLAFHWHSQPEYARRLEGTSCYYVL